MRCFLFAVIARERSEEAIQTGLEAPPSVRGAQSVANRSAPNHAALEANKGSISNLIVQD
jgi:hypothetical protein